MNVCMCRSSSDRFSCFDLDLLFLGSEAFTRGNKRRVFDQFDQFDQSQAFHFQPGGRILSSFPYKGQGIHITIPSIEIVH